MSQVPRIEHAAIFALINKVRLLNGWTTKTAAELDAMIRVWHEIFARHEIPVAAFDELYRRAFDVRQGRLRDGKDVPAMDAHLIVSQWTGDWGLRAELRNREIERVKMLPSNAETVCETCLGSGWAEVRRGRYRGVVRCDHGNGGEN